MAIRIVRDGQPGTLIFRMTRKNPLTGKPERRKNGRPWPIFLPDETEDNQP